MDQHDVVDLGRGQGQQAIKDAVGTFPPAGGKGHRRIGKVITMIRIGDDNAR